MCYLEINFSNGRMEKKFYRTRLFARLMGYSMREELDLSSRYLPSVIPLSVSLYKKDGTFLQSFVYRVLEASFYEQR